MRTRSWFWPFILIAGGGLLLLNTLGILNINFWGIIGPLILIAIGISILISHYAAPRAAEAQTFAIPLEGAEKAHIRVAYGAGRLRIAGSDSSSDLISGQYDWDIKTKTRREDGILKVKLEGSGILFPWEWSGTPRQCSLNLNKSTPLSLKLETGASEARIDLSELRVTDLHLETGMSRTEVILPAKAGYTNVRTEAGMAAVLLRVPEGVAARIRKEGGLSDIKINSTRFPRSGEFYESPDYSTAANKIDIKVEVGLGSVEIP
jgi:hypothetical protein